MKKSVAVLGFGKVGKTLLDKITNDENFKERFEVKALWNRSPQAFEEAEIPQGVSVFSEIEGLLDVLDDIDLVIECSHPSVLHAHGLAILEKSSLFVSSPTAFAQKDFHLAVKGILQKTSNKCYVALGASVGLWDVIRLDQNKDIKSLTVTMKKHPDSFKLTTEAAKAKLQTARETKGETLVIEADIAEVNKIAPQNTNTMSVYALAAQELGFEGCVGKVIADNSMDSHIVDLQVLTKGGLSLKLVRNNPASHGAVTGSATFNSFLNSVFRHDEGINHSGFVFC